MVFPGYQSQSMKLHINVPLKFPQHYLSRHLVPDDPNVPYEMLSVIKKIVDDSTGEGREEKNRKEKKRKEKKRGNKRGKKKD